eukprot:TRINITY_DN3242_c0_g3_i1.p1 TRINITY_DN3242_c0_g3~~TRINITY_DN3242_c0_g3_i1.p1  ORF type:complete len:1469 (-),score=523.21 TRINITY_DN3242_c0_g3_i1:34-4440(-)
MSLRGALPGLYVDPEIQILKCKRKVSAILEILRSINKQKEDVADLIDTMEHLEPVIDRILKNFQQLKKSDLGSIINKLNDSLSEFEELAVRMDKSGGIRRLMTSGAIRKKLEKLNLGMTKDIEMFVEIIVQAEVKEADRETAERPPRNTVNTNISPSTQRTRAASNNLIGPSIPNPQDSNNSNANGGDFVPPTHDYGHTRQILAAHAASLAASGSSPATETPAAAPAPSSHDYGHTRQILAAHAASLVAGNNNNGPSNNLPGAPNSPVPPSNTPNPLSPSVPQNLPHSIPSHPATPATAHSARHNNLDLPQSVEEILIDINRTTLKFPPIDTEERYASFASLMAAAEIQKSEWDNLINSPMADWNQLREFIQNQGLIIRRKDDEDLLHYILDEACMGAVSKTRYYEFLKGYGPPDRALAHIMELMILPYFYGYLSSKEAETLLHQQPPGTYLLRLARTSVDGFAYSISQGGGRSSHMLLQGDQPNGYILKDEGGQVKIFKNLKDVPQAYPTFLKTPLLTPIPTSPWFVGEKSSDECARMFSSGNAEAGTYVIRFSSQPGCFAATYLDSEKRVKNALIENLVDESTGKSSGFKIRGETPVYSSIDALISHYHTVLIRALNREPQASYHFGRVKRVGAANYVPPSQQESIVEVQVVEEVTNAPIRNSPLNAMVANPSGYEPPASSPMNISNLPNLPNLPTLPGSPANRAMNLPTILPTIPGSPAPVRAATQAGVYVSEIEPTSSNNVIIDEEPEQTDYIAKLGINDRKYPTRWMYLYADTLTVSVHKFYLTTTWIERMSSDIANGCAFRITSPEKRIVVIASDKAEMESFLPVVQIQILFILSTRGWITEMAAEGLLEMGQDNSKKRFAQYVFSSGDTYEGEWENGVFEGLGTHIKTDGKKYEGMFSKGLRSGYGVLVSNGREKYEGEFADNKRHGKGVQTYGENNQYIRYEGYFANDQRSGLGDLFYSNNGILRAIWENDKPSAQDKPMCLIFPNGERYVGEVMNASASFAFGYLPHGYGIMYYSNGDRYLGTWANNVKHGQGYFFANKTMEIIGDWENDKMKGNGTIVVNGSGTEPDQVIKGKITTTAPGMMTIRNALLKVGKFESMERKKSMLMGNQWKPFVTLPKFASWKRNEIVKVLDEGFSPSNVGKTDVISHLDRIFTCEFHPLGATVKSFCHLFNLTYKRITDHGAFVPTKDGLDSTLAFEDIHSFIGCISTHVAGTYRVLNSEEGLDKITRALFISILPIVYEVLIELLDSENIKANSRINEKKEIFMAQTLESKLSIVDLQDKSQVLLGMSGVPFGAAIQVLNGLNSAKSIFDKIACLEKTVEEINTILFTLFKSNFGADQLLPSICFAVFSSEIPNFMSQIQFINELLSAHLESVCSVGMQAYVITQFEIAIRFILELNKSELYPDKAPAKRGPRARLGTGRYSVIYKPTELDFASMEQFLSEESGRDSPRDNNGKREA